MKRVKLIVAYDGTNYCGWQVQPNGITIEQVLNENLSKLLGEEITVTGASRTPDNGKSDVGKSNAIKSILYTQLFNLLCDKADEDRKSVV